MCTCCLVLRPKTTVIGLEATLDTSEMVNRQYAQLAWSFPVVEGNAYEHHVGKGLYSAGYL